MVQDGFTPKSSANRAIGVAGMVSTGRARTVGGMSFGAPGSGGMITACPSRSESQISMSKGTASAHA
eukprot:scaffold26160_cov39-Tisochrysis_lutea.AAC.2